MTASATLGQARHTLGNSEATTALSASAFGAMAIFSATPMPLARMSMAGWRCALCFAIARRCATKSCARAASTLPPWRVLALAAMGGIGYVSQSYCFFTAPNYAQASLVALLLYAHLYPAVRDHPRGDLSGDS